MSSRRMIVTIKLVPLLPQNATTKWKRERIIESVSTSYFYRRIHSLFDRYKTCHRPQARNTDKETGVTMRWLKMAMTMKTVSRSNAHISDETIRHVKWAFNRFLYLNIPIFLAVFRRVEGDQVSFQ